MNLLNNEFNQLSFFANKKRFKTKSIARDDLEIKEITKLADKVKWNERFYKSYSGGKERVSVEKIATCKVFIAIYKGKEAGYIRICNYKKVFSKFSNGEVWGINEGYVKPAYRGNGILTTLRSYVVKNHNVKVMRIESDRYFRLKDYFAEQGFVYGYAIEEGELSAICVPEFLNSLLAFSKHKSAN
jgi:hypothetical protein